MRLLGRLVAYEAAGPARAGGNRSRAGGLYLLRAAVVERGRLLPWSSAAQNHLAQLVQDWRFPASGALLLIVPLISCHLLDGLRIEDARVGRQL